MKYSKIQYFEKKKRKEKFSLTKDKITCSYWAAYMCTIVKM